MAFSYDRFIILAVAIWFKKHLNQVFSNLVREIHKEILQAKQAGVWGSKENFIKKFYKLSKLGLKQINFEKISDMFYFHIFIRKLKIYCKISLIRLK